MLKSFEERLDEAKKLTRKERSAKNKAMWKKMSPEDKKKFTGDVAMPTAPADAKKKYGTAKISEEAPGKHDLPNTGKKSLFKSRKVKAQAPKGGSKSSGKRPTISWDESAEIFSSFDERLFEAALKIDSLLKSAMNSLNQSRKRRLNDDEKWYEAAYSVGATAAEDNVSARALDQWIKDWYSLWLQESGGKKVMTIAELQQVAYEGFRGFEDYSYDQSTQ